MEKILSRVKEIRYIKIRGKEYDLYNELGVSGDLNKIFIEHTEKSLFWGRLHSRERNLLRKHEDSLKVLESDTFIQYWQAHEEKNRQFSDGLIWSFVHKDDTLIEKRKEVRIQRSKVESLKTVCDAFEQRKSVLIHLGALYRREESELITRR